MFGINNVTKVAILQAWLDYNSSINLAKNEILQLVICCVDNNF